MSEGLGLGDGQRVRLDLPYAAPSSLLPG
jgi:hypothetical protein